jgi:putative endonuclease
MLRNFLHRIAGLFSRARPARAVLGSHGERLAEKHLKGKGFSVLGRNLRTSQGEVDLLCLDPDRTTVVIVEVKTRALKAEDATLFLPPEASITARKRRTLLRLANGLARANGWTHRPLRIDVVAVEWLEGREPTVRHHAGAVCAFRRTA